MICQNSASRIIIIVLSILIILFAGALFTRLLKRWFSNNWVTFYHTDNPRVEHFVLKSAILHKNVGVLVRLPDNYNNQAENTVIYYLHGSGGSEISDYEGIWSFLNSVVRKRKLSEPILVTINSRGSYFFNSMERVITDELVPLIDSRYRTNKTIKGRILMGFSIGGWAAVRISVCTPEVFGTVCSWGGRMWPGENHIIKSVHKNADKLRDHDVEYLLINGDSDRPDAFSAFDAALKKEHIKHRIHVLENQNHDLGKYLKRTGDYVGEMLAD